MATSLLPLPSLSQCTSSPTTHPTTTDLSDRVSALPNPLSYQNTRSVALPRCRGGLHAALSTTPFRPLQSPLSAIARRTRATPATARARQIHPPSLARQTSGFYCTHVRLKEPRRACNPVGCSRVSSPDRISYVPPNTPRTCTRSRTHLGIDRSLEGYLPRVEATLDGSREAADHGIARR